MSDMTRQIVSRSIREDWQEFNNRWKNCRLCPLWKQREHIVLWRGKIPCDVLFVGEAPGPSENLLGLPFVGPAGRVLDDVIKSVRDHNGYGAQSDPSGPGFSYAITNVLACFPPDESGGIRVPSEDEAKACSKRLLDFVRLANPKLIVLLGATAKEHFKVKSDATAISVAHPASLLRDTLPSQYGNKFARLCVPINEALKATLEAVA